MIAIMAIKLRPVVGKLHSVSSSPVENSKSEGAANFREHRAMTRFPWEANDLYIS